MVTNFVREVAGQDQTTGWKRSLSPFCPWTSPPRRLIS